MADGKKRYYWIKLRENFFDNPAIDYLQEQENGCEYIILYQKLCLLSSNSDGKLVRKIGEIFIPYDAKKISEVTRFDLNTVIVAMELFKKLGLVKIRKDGIWEIVGFSEMVGSETKAAEYQRKRREKLKTEPSFFALPSPKNAAPNLQTADTEISNEIEKSDIEVSNETKKSDKIFSNENFLSENRLSNEKEMSEIPVSNESFANFQMKDKRLEIRDDDDDDDIYRAGAGASAHTRTRSIEGNSELVKVLTCYQDNIHPISSQIERDRIIDLVDTFGAVWVTEAIHVSAINHAGTVRYVETVLESWRSSGSKEPWREERKSGFYAKKRSRNAKRKTQPDISDAESDGIDWSQFDNTYSGAEQAGTSDGT